MVHILYSLKGSRQGLLSANLVLLNLIFWIASAACGFTQVPATPQQLTVTPYERHLNLSWEADTAGNVSGYNIYRSTDGGNQFTFLKSVTSRDRSYAFDWTGDEGLELARHYRVTALAGPFSESTPSATVGARTFAMSDEQLLEMEQYAAFRYFWDYGHPVSGMAPERNTTPNVVTSGGSGFGVMAIVVAVERGWITREAALERMVQLVSFLQNADRFHGVFPHWMDGNTGKVIPFSQYDNGGDLVETAFLMQGLLTVRAYFNRATPLEAAVRAVITDLWEEVEWNWYRRNNSSVLYWHWSPNYGWQMNFPLRGFNEAHIVYILAVASPTHPIPASLYQSGWASNNYVNNSIQFGYPVLTGPFAGGPLFFAHYSYLGFDPRGIKDKYCNYFTRNRNHALIHRAYAIANPENHAGYSAACWGLTASDNPWGYAAHDPFPSNDNGTITPTAALASFPYTPEYSMAALRHFYRDIGEKLWGDFGFLDAFNPDQNWYAKSYIAIDQGPIVAMIENHRSGLLWKLFMQTPEIAPALAAIGFVPDPLPTTAPPKADFEIHISPNPTPHNTTARIVLAVPKPAVLSIAVTNIQGQLLRVLEAPRAYAEGDHAIAFDTKDLAPGSYFIQVQNINTLQIVTKKIIIF